MSASNKVSRRDALKTGAALTVSSGLPLTALASKAADDTPKPASPTFIGVYTDKLSYAPGDEVKVHFSANVTTTLQIARFGSIKTPELPTVILKGIEHPIPTDASSHGCRWPV